MSRENYQIFSEGKIGNMMVKNRLVKAATLEVGFEPDETASEYLIAFYRRLVKGGVGLIITGAMSVMQQGRYSPLQGRVDDDRYLPELEKLVKAVHDTDSGCKLFAQLHHTGPGVLASNHIAESVGPSNVPSQTLRKQCRELRNEEIYTIIDKFADAIERCKKAGFDGVELHGAHGYLLSSFFSSKISVNP